MATHSTYRNRWFVAYIVPVALAILVGLAVIHTLGIGPTWAFITGLGMSLLMDVWRDWVQSWQRARRETEAAQQ